MKSLARLSRCLAFAATIGLLMPQVSYAGNHRRSPVKDVTLQQGGTLKGAVLTIEGRHAKGAAVTISQNGEVVGKSVAKNDGRFAIGGLRPGVYAVSVGGTNGVLRLWANTTAPPASTPDLLLVDHQAKVVRGAHGGHLPQWEHPFLVAGMLAAAGVIGGVIGYNIKDDAS